MITLMIIVLFLLILCLFHYLTVILPIRRKDEESEGTNPTIKKESKLGRKKIHFEGTDPPEYKNVGDLHGR